MQHAMEHNGVESFIEESWAELEALEHQRKLCQLAVDTSVSAEQRARNWQMLARIEEQIQQLDERLDAVMNW